MEAAGSGDDLGEGLASEVENIYVGRGSETHATDAPGLTSEMGRSPAKTVFNKRPSVNLYQSPR